AVFVAPPTATATATVLASQVVSGALTGITRTSGVVAIGLVTAGTGYALSTTINFNLSPPQAAGGVTATASATTNASGQITSVTLTNSGSGYTADSASFTIPGGTATVAFSGYLGGA